MKNHFFIYKGVSLHKSDILSLIQKCFSSCLGFVPPLYSISHLCCYPTALPSYEISFKVNNVPYLLRVCYKPYHSSCLNLITNDYGGLYPTLGTFFDNEMIDFLDYIISLRSKG